MKHTLRDNLYLITIIFFVLGFFNIIFAWLGFICMILPFILLFKNKRKVWCQGICPRANLFEKLFKNRSLTGRAIPKFLVKGKGLMLGYFAFNLFVLTMSTIMVFRGVRQPVEKVRFLIAFKLPWNMPNLLELGTFPDWAVHLSFRIYSMMFTTTVLGLLLAWIFKPRSWCTVCPINTVSDLILKKTNTAINNKQGFIKNQN